MNMKVEICPAKPEHKCASKIDRGNKGTFCSCKENCINKYISKEDIIIEEENNEIIP